MAQFHHSRSPISKEQRLQYCTEPPSPPDATGIKSEFALQSALNIIQMFESWPVQFQNQKKDVQAQDQSSVILGLQYAALAKSVKGLYDETCDGLRGVMPGGAALTIEANKEMRMKPPASIVFLCLRGGVPRISNVENHYGEIVIYGFENSLQSSLSVLREQNADILEILSVMPAIAWLSKYLTLYGSI